MEMENWTRSRQPGVEENGNNGDDTRQQWRGQCGCHSSGAMGNFDIWPTMEWRVGPLYLVCAVREVDVRLSSLTEKIRLV